LHAPEAIPLHKWQIGAFIILESFYSILKIKSLAIQNEISTQSNMGRIKTMFDVL